MTYLPRLHSDEETGTWMTEVMLPTHEAIVALADGEVLGFAALGADMLDHLYVRPEAQNRGVGTKLLTESMRLRPGGLQLWVFQQNTGARGLYERHGFEILELGDGSGNEEGLPDAKYGWPGISSKRTQ